MKNATKHADALKSIAKKLIKQHDVPPRQAIDPLMALVRGALSFDASDSRVAEVMKTIDSEFVDLNEFRVATELELIEIIGPRIPDIDQRVGIIVTSLNAIFAREHALNLERIKALPKKEIRQFFRELPGVTPYVEAYTALYGFDQPAFPVDESALAFLQEEEILEEETTAEEAQKFVEHQLKDDDCYKLFYALRHRKKK